nr:ribonuclease H-like domain, reverse transcriptase, RNA-dependent DNA polymerase [Tanacetum cinerariifolium]
QSKEPQYIKRYHGMKKKPQTKSEARKNMIFYLKNTEGAEYVATASGCAQVLWIQNQLLDYGYNFIHTCKVSAVCINFIAVTFYCCFLRNMVIEIVVLNILGDDLPITTNGVQLTMSNPQERVDSP